MPLASVAAQNASLDNDYGTTRGPNSPDSHECALFDGDPLNGGVELSGNGYARAVVLPADWGPSEDGAKSASVTFPAPTGVWSAAPYWCLIDAADSTTRWESAAFDEPVNVTGASATPLVVTVTPFYGDGA